MHRLRWDNIARAAAAIAVVALVVAWPRLQARAPALPPAAAKPVTVEDPALVQDQAVPTETVERPAPAVRERARATTGRRPRRRPARHPAPPHPRAVSPAPRPIQAPAPAPAPVRRPSADDVAAGEFGLP
jgi:hypothetical protein